MWQATHLKDERNAVLKHVVLKVRKDLKHPRGLSGNEPAAS